MSELNASNLRKEHGNEGPDLSGTTELTSPYFMVPPSGNTADRPQNPQPGTLRFNTDIGTLEYFRGDVIGWESIDKVSPILNGSTRGFAAGGHTGPNGPGYTATIDYYGIDYPNIALDFGDLTATRGNGLSASASRTRGVTFGGFNEGTTMNYVTMSTTGNAIDFGDLLVWSEGGGSLSNSTRAIHGGGYDRPGSSGSSTPKSLNYITIASTGNAVDYGDLQTTTQYMASCASTTRGLWCGGKPPNPSSNINTIDYTTIASTGNTLDFGDLSTTLYAGAGCSNATRAIIFIGMTPDTSTNSNVIEFLTISTLGNALDFGDLTTVQTSLQAAASPTRASAYGGTGTTNWFVVDFATKGNAVEFGSTTDYSSSHVKYGGGGFSNGHGGL